MNIFQTILSWFQKKGEVIVPKNLTGSPAFNFAPPITNTSASWLPYFSKPYRTQLANGWDMDNCATRAAVETIEALLNYYLRNHLFIAPIETFFTNPKNGWLNANGDIQLSIRYNARENNTTQQGARVDTVWNNFAIYGVVPASMYPEVVDTWVDYYQDVPDDICMLGEYTITLIQILWSVVVNGSWQVPNIPLFQQKLQNSPLYFASCIGNRNSDGTEVYNGSTQCVHCRVLAAEDGWQEVLDSYSYPNYIMKLSQNFPLYCVVEMQIHII